MTADCRHARQSVVVEAVIWGSVHKNKVGATWPAPDQASLICLLGHKNFDSEYQSHLVVCT